MTVFPPGTLVLLPTSQAVAKVREHLLEKSCDGVLIGPCLYTPGRLEMELLNPWTHWVQKETGRHLPVSQKRLISDVAREMMLQKLVQERLSDFFPSRAISRRHASRPDGIVRRIGEIIEQLRSASIDPDRFLSLGENIVPRDKLQGMHRIYKEYAQFLEDRDLVDRAGMRKRLIRNLEQKFVPSVLRDVNEITATGFNRLTIFQVDLLKSLAGIIPKVVIELIVPAWALQLEYDYWSEAPENPFLEILYTIREIERSRDSLNGLELKLTDPEDVTKKPADLHVLSSIFRPERDSSQKSLFDRPAGHIEHLEVLAAPGRYEEVEAIGRNIWNLLEQGVAPSRIAFVVSDLGRYGQLIEDVFRRFRLPLFFRRGAPLEIQAPARALQALTRVAVSNWERELVLDILASPYFETGMAVPWARVAELSAEAGVTDERSGGGWERNLTRLALKKDEDQTEIQSILDGLNGLRNLLRPLSQRQTIPAFIQNIKHIFQKLKMEECISRGELEFLKRDAVSFKEMMAALGEFETAARQTGLENVKFPADELLPKFMKVIRDKNIGSSNGSGGGILIVNPYDLHGVTVDHLFFAGLNDGEFPSPRSEALLIDDSALRAFNNAAKTRVFTLSSYEYRQQELLFYHALNSARSSTTLSFTRTDEKNRIKLASALLDEVARLWPEGTLEFKHLPGGKTHDLEHALTREELFGRLSFENRCGNGESSGLGRQLLTLLISDPVEKSTWQSIIRRASVESGRLLGNAPEYSGLAGPEPLKPWHGRLPRHDGFPIIYPTFLQKYSQCPFLFWVEQVLKAEMPYLPEDEPSPRDEGSLIHEILCRFMTGCQSKGLLPLNGQEAERDMLLEAINDAFAESEKKIPLGREALWDVKAKKLRWLLIRWLECEQKREDGLVPTCFEWSFGPKTANDGRGRQADWPPLEIPLVAGGRIFMRGRIDRIDLGQGKARVLDYKNSGNSQSYYKMLKEEELGESSFQAPIYQVAAAEAFQKPAEAGWVLLKELPEIRTKTTPPTSLPFFDKDLERRKIMQAEGLPNFFNRLETAWLRILRGDFRPQASSDENCAFCPCVTACRISSAGEGDES